MTNCGEQTAVMDDEHTGQLAPIRTREANTVATQDGGAKPRPPHAWMRQLAERGVLKPERPVEVPVRITYASEIGHAVAGKPPIGFVG